MHKNNDVGWAFDTYYCMVGYKAYRSSLKLCSPDGESYKEIHEYNFHTIRRKPETDVAKSDVAYYDMSMASNSTFTYFIMSYFHFSPDIFRVLML